MAGKMIGMLYIYGINVYMRLLLTTLACTAFFSLRAQTPAVITPVVPTYLTNPDNAANTGHKWRFQTFTSMNLGYMFLGSGLTYVSVPVGVALYRPLNNNFTAFTAATLAPMAFHFSSLYNTPFHNPMFPGNGVTGLGVNAALSGGLIYTNDAHTFSISGSISVERGSYPVYFAPARTSARKQY